MKSVIKKRNGHEGCSHKRRYYYAFLILLLLIFISGCDHTSREKPVAAEKYRDKKNILFVISDDLATHAIGAYGNGLVRTPNMDRLAESGVRFTSAFCTSPMCTPSRASLLTGRYPHAAGTTLLNTALPEEQMTIAEHLAAQGYATGMFGKTHFNSGLKHGFQVLVQQADHEAYLKEVVAGETPASVPVRPAWKPFQDPARVWLNADSATSGVPDEYSEGTYFVRQAAMFMEENKDAPFFVCVSFREPHSPFNFPAEYYGRYDIEDISLPETSPEDDRWLPEVFADLTDADKKGIIRSYYTSVEYMDKNVGLILDELDRLGLKDDTLVVLVGDQGYLLGHHKRFEKHMMWEEAVASPLIVSGFDQGKVSDALVEFTDVVPTMLAAVGQPPMSSVQGISLMPLLTGETESHKSIMFSEHLLDNKAMVRTDRWKLIFTSGKYDLGGGYATGKGPSGLQVRLYDEVNDPMEHHDLAADPEYRSIVKNLKEEMLRIFVETHPGANALPGGLNIDEQLSWFCEAPEFSSKKVPEGEYLEDPNRLSIFHSLKYLVENDAAFDVVKRNLPGVPEPFLMDAEAESLWEFLQIFGEWVPAAEFDPQRLRKIDDELRELNVRVEQQVNL